jgi:hypothetical protein
MMRVCGLFTLCAFVALSTTACGDDDTGDATSGAGGGTSSDTSASSGGGGGMCKAFGEACVESQDTCCDTAGVTGSCFAFGMGPRCTIPCPTDPGDCPKEGRGCNMQSPQQCKP